MLFRSNVGRNSRDKVLIQHHQEIFYHSCDQKQSHDPNDGIEGIFGEPSLRSGTVFEIPGKFSIKLRTLASLAATCAVVSGLHDLRYDHNLLNMQPEGLESVEVERRLLRDCDQSVWYALSMADSREELLERKGRLVLLPTVERVDEIASLVPAEWAQRLPRSLAPIYSARE